MLNNSLLENRKKWSENDLRKLEIAYNMGASLEIMALVVGRTPSATNKTLTRYGIRPLGCHARGVKPGTKYRHVTYKHVISVIERAQKYLENNQDFCLESHMRIEQIPLLDSSFSKKNRSVAHLSAVTPLETVIQYLNRVKIKTSPTFIHGREAFQVQDQILSKTQLLILANKKRLEHNKPVFWLEDLTAF